MGIPLFVYGTLLSGAENHEKVEPYVIRIRSGKVKGRLVDAGGYPALLLDTIETLVVGEWIDLKHGALPVLDEFEGYYGVGKVNDYERVWLRDAEIDEEGWVYIWRSDRGCKSIQEGDWLKHTHGF